MTIGLNKEEIETILEQKGIVKDDIIVAETVRIAIATAIEENNKRIEDFFKNNNTAKLG